MTFRIGTFLAPSNLLSYSFFNIYNQEIMDRFKHYADVPTPIPGAVWSALNERQRSDKVLKKLQDSPVQFLSQIEVVTAKADGQVIVHMKQSLPASQRGPFLLDLEDYLRDIDQALVVWLEPLGDKNSLRNLRGIEVKA